MTDLDLPQGALVLLIGAAGSGKTTLAARLFSSEEILASDDYRAAVSGDPADQTVNDEAFDRLHADLERRMAAGELTVVDATNVQAWARRRLRAAAEAHHRPMVAVVLALPLETSLARNAARGGGSVPPSAVRRQDRFLRTSLSQLAAEGYASVMVLTDPDQIDRLVVRREPGAANVPKERHPAL